MTFYVAIRSLSKEHLCLHSLLIIISHSKHWTDFSRLLHSQTSKEMVAREMREREGMNGSYLEDFPDKRCCM